MNDLRNLKLACQCENEAHFESEMRTPNGNPGHNYGMRFLAVNMVQRVTSRGTFWLCKSCASDCYSGGY